MTNSLTHTEQETMRHADLVREALSRAYAHPEFVPLNELRVGDTVRMLYRDAFEDGLAYRVVSAGATPLVVPLVQTEDGWRGNDKSNPQTLPAYAAMKRVDLA